MPKLTSEAAIIEHHLSMEALEKQGLDDSIIA